MNKKIAFLVCIVFLLSLFQVGRVYSASDMAKAQKGKILLQVESNGEAWYVNPADENRYFMGRPEDAFGLMRQLGVGITSKDLDKIDIAIVNEQGTDQDGDGLSDMFEDAIGTDKMKADSDGDGFDDKTELNGAYNPLGSGYLNTDKNFGESQKGRILLAVERNGEAWYINPTDGKRYFMGRPHDAFNLMRALGLGISNDNLNKIAVQGDNIQENDNEGVGDTNDDLSDLSDIIVAHQVKIKKFIEAYDNDDFDTYYDFVDNDCTISAQDEAAERVTEFFTDFMGYGLKKIDDLDLMDEWEYAQDNEDVFSPYEKIDDTTILIGVDLEGVMPYELKFEDGAWKLDLALAQKYFVENEKIADIDEEAEGSEVELYLMNKIKSALKSYKKQNGAYPTSLYSLISTYPVLTDYVDFLYYAYSPDASSCHFGIEIYDDARELNQDKDYNSLDDDFLEGFEGVDPIYDIILE